MVEKKSINWQELFNQLPRAIAVLDSDGSIQYGNEHLKFHYKKWGESLTFRYEPVQKKWQDFLTAFIKNDKPYDQIILIVPDNTENKRWFSIKLTRSSSDSRIFMMEEDITDQQIYEQNLKKARDAAEQATKTKSEFLANMSHEIRTPIHTIIGMSELMNLTKLDQEQDEYSSQIRFSADVLLSLINDILDFSKIEAGQLELEYTSCNLQDLLEDSVDLIALEAHKKGVDVGLYAEPGTDFLVEGDPTRLRQVAVNLTNNAVKFTQKGQVMIYLTRQGQDARSVTIKVSVKDSGIGIPDEKKQRLFDAFTQADSSTTRKFGGTGLGLTISKNLVAQMGGDLQVESEPGVGSEFFFTLSFPRSVPYRTVSSEYEFGDALKGISVLLVDDNKCMRDTLSSYLKSWGCIVDIAGGGRDAISMLRTRADGESRQYDLCICDQMMPEVDGWQLASEVRADSSLSGLKMILMSLKGRGTEEAKMKLLGWFSAYITKPVRKKDLWDKCILALFPDQAELGDLEELEDFEELEELDDMENTVKTGEPSPVTNTKEVKMGRILIAEDHPVNRKLFESILVKQGYSVLLAENGKEALEIAIKESPDLIFMDCQMPVMNGYEATRLIREEGLKIPIVAVTANAMQGEQDKCFRAGMNDFLPKPFKNKDLLPVLKTWYKPIGSSQVEDLEVLEESEETVKKQSSQNVPVFDFNQAMDTFLDDRELLISLLKPYIKQVDEQLAALSEPGALEDFDELRATAHSIKGSSRNLSMLELGNESEALEHAGRDADLNAAMNALPRVSEAFVKVKRVVEKILEKESGISD